jgi:hypothetical protein
MGYGACTMGVNPDTTDGRILALMMSIRRDIGYAMILAVIMLAFTGILAIISG